MSTVQVTYELPAEIAATLDPSGADVSRRALEALLVHLFHLGEISSGRAAELLGCSKDDFRQLLHEHGVPYVDLTEEELLEDLHSATQARLNAHL